MRDDAPRRAVNLPVAGEIHEDDEVLCLVKTHPALFNRLRNRILELHPYDVPEILAFTVHDSSSAYIDWLHRSVAVTERGPG